MTKILQTKDYTIFKKRYENRDLKPHLIEILKESISKKNLLSFFPITVNGKMEVMDGQNRLEACRQLGETVWYTINDDMTDEDMLAISTNMLAWGYLDYLEYFCKKGYPEYKLMKQIMDDYSIGHDHVMKFRAAGNMSKKGKSLFTCGELKLIPESVIRDRMEKFQDIVSTMKDHMIGNKEWLKQKVFFLSIIIMLNDPDFDVEYFKQKVILQIHRVKRCPSAQVYIELWQDIYNYKLRNKVDFTVSKSVQPVLL
jgi:hypothetical protein